MTRKKRIVIALGGNALGNTLPEQMAAVKITAHAIVDLIEEGCEVVIAHGNGPQVGMVNNAMLALTHEDAHQPNTPLSVCVAMSQAYIGYDLQNALREELLNRNITDIPVATMITQVRVDEHDPAFACPSKPIGRFLTKEQADEMSQKYDYIMKEDAGRGYRRVVASPKPQEIIEIGTIRTMVDSGDLVCLWRRRNSGHSSGQSSKRCQCSHRQRFCQCASRKRTGCRCSDHPHCYRKSSHSFRDTRTDMAG